MKFETSNKPLSVFNFSSLTDIVLLLLIFFLLTSQFVVKTGVKVKLPGSKQNKQSAPAKIIVSITSDGVLYLGNEKVASQELPAKLSNLKKETKEQNLIIRADKAVNIDRVIQVIDAAKAAKIDRFTIETEKESF